jgi:hypothetical protein
VSNCLLSYSYLLGDIDSVTKEELDDQVNKTEWDSWEIATVF